MDTSKLAPRDPRVEYKTASVRGKTYSYILGVPPGGREPIDTILLCHGFPDVAYGWRNQIPVLMALGFRVICPDMLGYAGTDAPEDVALYSHKNVAADTKALVEQIIGPGQQIILGGHDWGGAQVFRTVLWHPELVKAAFSICTPYVPPGRTFVPLEELVRTRLPNFAYQLQFRGPEVQEKMQGADMIRRGLSGIWEARGPGGEAGVSASRGLHWENLHLLGDSPHLSGEETAHMVAEYMKQPAPQMRGPTNWYRTREVNFADERALVEDKGDAVGVIDIPVLFVGAALDFALPPAMSVGMERCVPKLTRREVHATHWALVQVADEVNGHIVDWLDEVLQGKVKSSL